MVRLALRARLRQVTARGAGIVARTAWICLQNAVLAELRKGLTDPEVLAYSAQAFKDRWDENNRKNTVARTDLQKRLDRVQGQIKRLHQALLNSDDAVDGIMEMLKPLEREKTQLAEGLRMMEADRSVDALLPNAIDQYKAALIALPRASRTMRRPQGVPHAGRLVVVHPVAPREPYDFSIYGRLAAILGEDVFPSGNGGTGSPGGDGQITSTPRKRASSKQRRYIGGYWIVRLRR